MPRSEEVVLPALIFQDTVQVRPERSQVRIIDLGTEDPKIVKKISEGLIPTIHIDILGLVREDLRFSTSTGILMV